MAERWRLIDGFEKYLVSDEGRVKNGRTGRVLSPGRHSGGYLKVGLCISGKVHKKFVHRLVAEAFIPNPDNLPFVDHINTERMDNRAVNLRWCTREENMRNMRSNTGSSSSYKGVCWSARDNKWLAQIKVGEKHMYLGLFMSEEAAAHAYDAAALEHYGDFARVNFPAA